MCGMDTERCKKIMEEAIERFNRNKNEIYLIKNNLSERCICARFAYQLEDILKSNGYVDHTVDVEYNRDDCNIKKIGDEKIYPDLIAHKRGYTSPGSNLICAEMKKNDNMVEIKSDEDRLIKMTSGNGNFRYVLGCMIIVHKDGKPCLKIKKMYHDGKSF